MTVVDTHLKLDQTFYWIRVF